VKALLTALLFILITASLPVKAETDYSCFQSCTAGGKSTSECLPRCSNNTPGVKKLETYTDYRCLQTCVGGGKQSETCLPQCTYVKTDSPSDTGRLVADTPPPFA